MNDFMFELLGFLSVLRQQAGGHGGGGAADRYGTVQSSSVQARDDEKGTIIVPDITGGHYSGPARLNYYLHSTSGYE